MSMGDPDRNKRGLLQIRSGYSPNCSSYGSVVGIAMTSAALAAVVVNMWADRFAAWLDNDDGGDAPDGDGGPNDSGGPPEPNPTPDAPTLRVESFGGILGWPDGQIMLDQEATHAAHAAGARVVGSGAVIAGAMSAPVEVHLAVTNRCPASCTGCYLSAGPDQAFEEPDLAATLDELQAMGVLQVALGGGEAMLRRDVFDIARAVRDRGMVPNLTTSGFGVTPLRAKEMAELFGQINVSIDGVGETYTLARGWDGTQRAVETIEMLVAAGARVGANTVLTRPLWETPGALETLGEALRDLGVQEWQWLRFKPTGRGRDAYEALAPDLHNLWPRLLSAEAQEHSMRIDCALTPFLPDLPVERMQTMGVVGCPGGHSLWARSATGHWAPCSFVQGDEKASSLEDAWSADPTLLAWRQQAETPPEPCASCPRQSVCRGGCRAVALHLTGDALAPDPECPRVLAWQADRLDVVDPVTCAEEAS